MRVDRDQDPTVVESFLRTVDWPALSREGEGLELGADLDPVTVESAGYGFDGLQAVQLRRLGWHHVASSQEPVRAGRHRCARKRW